MKTLVSICSGLLLLGLVGCSQTEEVASNHPFLQVSGPADVDGELGSVTEPKYHAPPYYCQMAVGANRDSMMWVVVDGQDMYIDLNGNEDLTEPNEKIRGKVDLETKSRVTLVFEIGDLKCDDVTHTDTVAQVMLYEDYCTATFSTKLGGKLLETNSSIKTPFELAGFPEMAPLIHFDGPRTMGLFEDAEEWVIGDEFEFYAVLGTAGDGLGSMTALPHDGIPEDVHPTLQVVGYDEKTAEQKVYVSAVLDQRC